MMTVLLTVLTALLKTVMTAPLKDCVMTALSRTVWRQCYSGLCGDGAVEGLGDGFNREYCTVMTLLEMDDDYATR